MTNDEGAPAWHGFSSMAGMRFPFLATMSLFIGATASGQQLGQTKEAIVASNGSASEENHSKNTAVYRSGPWKFDIVYADGIATKLTVTRTDSLTDEEIRSVLANNADGASGAKSGSTEEFACGGAPTLRLPNATGSTRVPLA